MITLKRSNNSVHDIITNTVDARTAGGSLKQIRPDYWPEYDVFKWEFIGVKQEDLDLFLQFAKDNAGLDIIVTDEYDEEWIGIILTEIFYSQTHRKQGQCDQATYKIEFEFEGTPYGGA